MLRTDDRFNYFDDGNMKVGGSGWPILSVDAPLYRRLIFSRWGVP